MGQAILSCVVNEKVLKPSEIALFDSCAEKTVRFAKDYNVCASAENLVSESEFVLLAVKPQQSGELLKNLTFCADNTIITIMAGVKIDNLRSKINYPCAVARVMPNTPCRIGKGVCAVCFRYVSEEKQLFVEKILSTCGKVVPLEEKYFDAVTSVSGSGPAYVYMFIDGMIKGGIDGGLTYEQSKTLAVNTVIGTAYLAENSEEDMDALTEKVCSKGGTTIEAVNIYRQDGLEDLIRKGIAACKKRSEELGKN